MVLTHDVGYSVERTDCWNQIRHLVARVVINSWLSKQSVTLSKQIFKSIFGNEIQSIVKKTSKAHIFDFVKSYSVLASSRKKLMSKSTMVLLS